MSENSKKNDVNQEKKNPDSNNISTTTLNKSWMWMLLILSIGIIGNTIRIKSKNNSSDPEKSQAKGESMKIEDRKETSDNKIFEITTFQIGPELSQETLLPTSSTHTLSHQFLCNQPYEVINNNNESYKGEANEDITGGCSTANSLIRVRTRNNTTTTMKIISRIKN